MHKRILLIVTALMLMIPAGLSYASDNMISLGSSSVTSGTSMDFTVDVSGISDEYEDYTVAVSVSPTPDSLSVFESVNAVIEGSTCLISSSNLSDVSTLHFSMTAGEVTEETSGSVAVSVTSGGDNVKSDSASFTIVPVETEEETTEDETSEDETSEETDSTEATEETDSQESGKQGSAAMGNTSGGKASAAASSGSSGSSDSKTTYAGSAVNYLDKLSVKGYEFTQDFNKTKDTYFITVESGTESVSVCATPTDSSANVAITGNDDLSEGRNKIMVSVTADNGDVRVYRIYVDVK